MFREVAKNRAGERKTLTSALFLFDVVDELEAFALAQELEAARPQRAHHLLGEHLLQLPSHTHTSFE